MPDRSRSVRPARLAAAGAALALLAMAACGDSNAPPQSGTASNAGPGGGRMPRVTPVELAPVELGTIARRVTVSGTVEPIRTIGVNSQLSGELRSVNVEEGDVVRAGAVLARLDDRELRAQLSSAQASYEVTRAAADRAERLREQQIITAAEYERDRAVYVASRSQLEQLETRVGFATILSPINGVVTEKRVETGDVVGNQTRLFSIADLSTRVVRVQLSELDVVAVSPGDRVEVVLDAVPDRSLTGSVRRVFPSADPTTRLVPVEIALGEDAAGIARPGFLARARFSLGQRDAIRLVPAAAVIGAVGDQSVFTVDGGRAVRRPVRTGAVSEGRVEITEGLEPGELVIVAGNSGMRSGDTVRVVGGELPDYGAVQGGGS